MKIYRVRYLIQILFILFLFYGASLGLRLSNFMPVWACPNSVDYSPACYLLPLQRFQSGLNEYRGSATPLPAFFIMEGWRAYLALFLILIAFIIVFNKLWCGWMCPFGAFQDFLNFVRKKLRIKKIQFSEETRRNLKPIKYISLISLLYLPILFAFGFSLDWPLFCKICPARALLSVSYGNIMNLAVGFPPGVLFSILTCVIAGFTLVAALFVGRFFCFFCPVSALINIFNKISFIQLKKSVKFCSYCGNCWRACPMNIKEVYTNRSDGNIIKDDCNLCLTCLEKCPGEKAISVRYFGKTIIHSLNLKKSKRA